MLTSSFLFLLLLFLFLSISSSSSSSSRRALHQPFSPIPFSSPSPSQLPFFPTLPSPPPPLPQPTLPASISSPTHHHRHPSSLLPAILLPILSLLALAISVAFFFDHGLCSPSSAPPRLKPSLPPAAAASPDLLPIPPLPRPPDAAAAAALSSSEEEFFSPSAPAAMAGNSISRRDAAAAEKCVPQNSILSTPPYPSSPSPGSSSRRSECPKTAVPQLPIPPLPPPPPPPPPPPVGYWESRVRKHDAHHLPALMPLRTVGLRNSAAAVFPAQPPQDSDAAARNERTPRPKLKPLHWDKVRASPDRVTVWDQLRSSSFQ